MRRKILILMILMISMSVFAKQVNIRQSLLGSWRVEGIEAHGSTKFTPPSHAIHWTFERDGTMIERLGKSGHEVRWCYVVIGHDIKVSLENMSFTWHILGIDDKVMLIQHQLGLFKIRRM